MALPYQGQPINLATYQEESPPPPPPEPVAPPPPQAAPAPQSAPQPVNLATYGGTTPAPAAPPPQQQFSTQPAPVQGLPTATPRGLPSGPTPLEHIPVIGPALQGVANVFRGGDPTPYRPGSPEGLGPESYATGVAQAQQTFGASPTPGNLLQLAGAYKDQNRGTVTPEMSGNQIAKGDVLYAIAKTGAPPAWTQQPQVGGAGPSWWDNHKNDPDVQKVLAGLDKDNIIRAYEEGYTTPDGIVWAPGGMAVHEYSVGGLTVPQRAFMDLTDEPIGTLGGIALGGIGGLGKQAAIRGGELTARGLGGGKALEVAGKTAQAVERVGNIPLTAGLSEAVPGAFKLGGKALSLTPLGKPTARALAREAVEATGDVGLPNLAARRAAGPVGGEISYVSKVGPGKQVTRVTLPADGANPPLDLAFAPVGPKKAPSDLIVYDDPATLTTYHRATEADFDTAMAAMGRLGQKDRAALHDPWYRVGTTRRTATGENFLEASAPDIPARKGLPAASSNRNAAAYQRHLDDAVAAIERFDDPGTETRPYLYNLMDDWRRTLYDGTLHPATGRPLAEHRLQTIRDILARAPGHDNAYTKKQLARMEAMLPTPPGAIGSGKVWQRASEAKGIVAGERPFSPAETRRMEDLASISTKDFWRKRGKGIAQLDYRAGLLSRVRPGANPKRAAELAYENYQGLLATRLNTPVLQRAEVGAIRNRLSDAAVAPPTSSLAKELDGLKEALERNGIVAAAARMNVPDILTAIDAWDRANPPFRIDLPTGGASIGPPPAIGTYPMGGMEELFRRAMPRADIDAMEETYTLGGVTHRVGERLVAWQDQFEAARRLAQRGALSAAEERQVARVLNQHNALVKPRTALTAELLAQMDDARLDHAATLTAMGERGKALGVDEITSNRLWRTYDGYLGALRSMFLYNRAKGIVYPAQQTLGNLTTNIVAAPHAVGPFVKNLFSLRRAVNWFKDPANPKPAWLAHLDRRGLPSNATLARISRDEGMGPYTWFHDPEAGTLRKMGRALVSQAAKDYGDGADFIHRLSLHESIMRPAEVRLNRDLPAIADRVFREARTRTNLPLPLSRADIDAALKTLERNTNGEYSALELRDALFQAAGGRGAANSTEVYNAADRVQRIFSEELRKLSKAGDAEVERVAFAAPSTNLDETLSRLVMFSWWNTRAARLYMTSAATSPVQLGLWSRAIAAGERNRLEGASGPYKDWIEFMRTPAGFVSSFNPVSLLATVGLFATMDPASPKSDLTQLGQWLEGGWLGNNFFLAPPLKAALRVTGLLGPDARRPDLLGTVRTERAVNDALEWVNYHVNTFSHDTTGHPVPVPNVDLNAFQDLFAHKLAEMLPGYLPPNPSNPAAGFEANLTYAVRDELLARNPELGQQIDPETGEAVSWDLERAIDEAMLTPASEVYQAALGRTVDALWQGPGTGQSGAMNVLAALTRFVSPFEMSTLPSSRLDTAARKNRDAIRQDLPGTLTPEPETTAVDRLMGFSPWKTPAGRQLGMAEEAYYGTAQQQTVSHMMRDLRYGTPSEPVTVLPGITFSPEQIAQMSQKDRNAVAYAWLEESGNAEQLDAYYAGREQAVKDHPELAMTLSLGDYARQYDGGVAQFVTDTAAINPNYRAYLAQAVKDPSLQQTNPEEWEKAVLGMGAPAVIAGIKESQFGPAVDPKYAGVVAGLKPGKTLDDWYRKQQRDDSGDGTNENWGTLVEGGLDDFNATLGKLNQYDPSGATTSQYLQNLIDGSSKPIPYAAYSAGVRGFVPDDAYPWSKYVAWVVNQPSDGDTSPATWNKEDRADYNRQRTIEIANEFASGAYVPSDPVVTPEEPAAPAAPSPTPATLGAPSAAPVAAAPSVLQGVGNALGGLVSGIGDAIGRLTGHNGQSGEPPTKPGQTSLAARKSPKDPYANGTTPFSYDVVPSKDGMGVQSTRDGSDRTWMEQMIGPNHAIVTTDYKGPAPDAWYGYQLGHGATDQEHAAYDISCDTGYRGDGSSTCPGTPIKAPLAGVVTCAGYGQGQSTMPGATCNYSLNTTRNNPDGSPAAHTIVIDVGTDPQGNRVQLSFNHMGTSVLQPGQRVKVGDLLGGMGDTDGGPHVHLEGWGVCPKTGTYQILDPQLIVGGYYRTHSVC